MKKFLLILCSMIMLVGCGNIDSSEITSEIQESTTEEPTEEIADIEQKTDVPVQTETTTEITNETTTESTTVKPTEPEKIEPMYTEISDNIKLYDLNKSENSELIPDEKIFYSLYPNDIEMLGYGILSNEDGNIKLVKDNGEENVIVESPYSDNAYSWVRIEFPIDSDRFAYSLCGEWGNTGFGVYDLQRNENHLIVKDEYAYYPKVVRGNSLILAKEKYFNTVGYSEFDLDIYEISDIPIQADLENLKCRRTNDVSADGRLSAVIRYEDNSYIITVISLENGKIINEYILKTDKGYGNMELEFASADKLNLYAKRHEDNIYHLYVFNII